jgi:hypothetical protein
MNHPFALDISDLETIELNFEETLSDEEANQVTGGLTITTQAVGEEGGHEIVCISAPCPGSEGGDNSGSPSKRPPKVTTLAIGEEGGHPVTKAWLEVGGRPIYW